MKIKKTINKHVVVSKYKMLVNKLNLSRPVGVSLKFKTTGTVGSWDK